ncbi:glycosyltransferase family 39 protein [Roseibium sp.]|uniref:glycosyltransferase family 39 protein n=1 Tax=Roseibium sp. TaxID=1936156 RepID=UPI003A96A2C9
MAHETDGTTATRTTRAQHLLLGGILLLAAAFRLPAIGRTSFWYDEAVSWSQSNGSLQHLLSSVAADNYPPLHNIVLWLTMKVAGDSETVLRFPSLVASLLAVFLIYRLGRTLFGTTAGLLAAFLLATSPFHLWYASEARMYALFDLAGLAMLLSIVAALGTGKRRSLLAVVLTTTAFLYTHIYALFGVTSVGLVLVIMCVSARPENRKPLMLTIGALVAAGILFLPWLIVLVGRARDVTANGFWIAYPDLNFLIVMVRDMAGSEWLFMLLMVTALAGLATSLFRQDPPAPASKAAAVVVVIAAAAGPFILAYTVSLTLQPILFDRYLIAAWSAFLVLAAGGATRVGPRLAPLALGALSIYLAQDRIVFSLTDKIRPEWRTVASAYLSESSESAPIVLTKAFARPAIAYYVRDDARVIATDRPEEIARVFSGQDEAWLLLAHSSRPEMARAVDAVPDGFAEDYRTHAFGWGESGLTLIKYSTP